MLKNIHIGFYSHPSSYHIVDTVAGCEKHTPAYCALCPFDFTPKNTLWIPPFCHIYRNHVAQPLISLSGSSRTPPEHPQMASLDWHTHTEDLVLLLQKVPCLSLRSGHRIWGIFMKNKKHLHHKRSENIKQHEWFISDIMARPILLQCFVYMIYSYIFYIFFQSMAPFKSMSL